MPLIMMCGLPCSGKTHRAEQIAAFIAASDLKAVPVHVVNDEFLNLERNEAYKGAQLSCSFVLLPFRNSISVN